jgi:hypothetical protein
MPPNITLKSSTVYPQSLVEISKEKKLRIYVPRNTEARSLSCCFLGKAISITNLCLCVCVCARARARVCIFSYLARKALVSYYVIISDLSRFTVLFDIIS